MNQRKRRPAYPSRRGGPLMTLALLVIFVGMAVMVIRQLPSTTFESVWDWFRSITGG
ncbi:hypothetical protein [Fodinicola acaciae]|uniref:hypothetical protein n=1 Tax=Fodinicola acaciae TaxID=2681555 RepID=UPI0013D4DCB1|nr:hypothetical protein [Fodinicola acaciae]